MIASRIASLIWSHILSGWPSVTDSEVNRYSAASRIVVIGLLFVLGQGSTGLGANLSFGLEHEELGPVVAAVGALVAVDVKEQPDLGQLVAAADQGIIPLDRVCPSRPQADPIADGRVELAQAEPVHARVRSVQGPVEPHDRPLPVGGDRHPGGLVAVALEWTA